MATTEEDIEKAKRFMTAELSGDARVDVWLEMAELRARIEELQSILADREKVYAIIKEDLADIKARFGSKEDAKRRTELVAALIMLIGAAIGAQIGAVATKYIRGYGIRAAFGAAVIGCLCSVVLKLIQPYFPAYAKMINNVATVVVLGFVISISGYIFVKMVQGAAQEIAENKRQRAN